MRRRKIFETAHMSSFSLENFKVQYTKKLRCKKKGM
uniref:Uncharacterized protein n=1 Tax=Heterorhabditis bacteriophora TaxID=37862 RepID=A0A1I7WB20_HETBA